MQPSKPWEASRFNSFVLFYLKSKFYNLKVASITVYEARPEILVYHSHEFHVVDIQVNR